MTCEPRTDAMEPMEPEQEQEQEQAQAQAQTHNTEDRVVVRRDGVLRSVLRGLFWPFGVVVRAYRGVWWVMGLQQPRETAVVSPVVPSPARHSLAGRKRLRRVTRLLLSILPRWVQSALGYPVSSSIGRSLSPEIRVSPTKPCGKGSKRKQDELEDEEEEEHQTWVEALSQELADDEDPEEDPDYEPSSVETESEEYRSQNNTESDIEVQGKGVVIIEDVETITPTPPNALSYPVSSSIGRSLSPEIRVSPTKPCDKGSTRKQDELEDEEEHQTWVEALGQELADDEDPEEDPDYEPSSVETDSEEYCSQNNTESDIEVQGKGVVIIEDVETDTEPPTPVQVVCPPV